VVTLVKWWRARCESGQGVTDSESGQGVTDGESGQGVKVVVVKWW
jgi:hypothetical protein